MATLLNLLNLKPVIDDQGKTKYVQTNPPQRIEGLAKDGDPDQIDYFGWIYGLGKYASSTQMVHLGTSQNADYYHLVTHPYYGSGEANNIYTDMMGISEREIIKKIQNGTFKDADVPSYWGKRLVYNGWNLITVGFVERNGERYEALSQGLITEDQYNQAAWLDGATSILAVASGARVGLAAEARWGAGLRSMAAESVTYSLVDTAGQTLVYKSVNGQGAQPVGADTFFQNVTMDMMIGSGLHLLGRIDSGGKTVWKAPTADNPLNYRMVMPTPTGKIDPRYHFAKGDTSGRSLLMANGGKFTSAISGKEIQLPEFGKKTSKEMSEWLEQIQPEMKAYADKLIEANHPNASWEEKAIIAMNVRNAFVNAARQGISDVRVINKLENNRPLWSYKDRERALATDEKKPLSGEALNKKIYDEAFDVKELKLETKHVQCFPAGTLVHTDKGLVPIQDIKVGDMVLSRPEWGGRDAPTEYKRVARAFCSGEEEIVKVSCVKSSEHAEDYPTIYTEFMTPQHPVWIESLREWLPVSDVILQWKKRISIEDIHNNTTLSSINNNDNLMIIAVDKIWDSLSTNEKIGIAPSVDPLRDLNEIDMIISFEKTGYKVDYDKYNSEYYFPEEIGFKVDDDVIDNYQSKTWAGNSAPIKIPVYNLEIEDYHTYFIGEQGLWVHNDNCFYEYLPNLVRDHSPLPNNIVPRTTAGSRIDTLPDFVNWTPTLENVKEMFLHVPSLGGIFARPDTYRIGAGGDFERGVWGARYDTNIGRTGSHIEYGVVFNHPRAPYSKNIQNYRMYEGIKKLENGKVQVIDRKRYTWADEDRQYVADLDDPNLKPYPISRTATTLVETMYRDVLAMSSNPNTVDSVIYSFHSSASVGVFDEMFKNKIIQSDFGGIKPPKDWVDDKGNILVSGNDMLEAVRNAFLSNKIRGVFDVANFQLVANEGINISENLSNFDIDSLLPIAKNYWLQAGASQKVLDSIQFHIADLDTNVAAITEGAQITLDATGAGWGWFIDPTPLDNSEFIQGANFGMDAPKDSAAYGKLDLLTVLIHEMGHALGMTPKLADDVMTRILDTGERRLPSELDALWLQRNASDLVAQTGVQVLQTKAWTAPTTRATLTNNDFTNQGDNWLTTGDIRFDSRTHSATLSEAANTQTSLRQAFSLTADNRLLSFTIADKDIKANANQAGDAFEAALLDAHTGQALTKVTDLIRTDSLLNIQADGTERLATGITKVANNDGTSTYYIDLTTWYAAQTAAGKATDVMLSFDLLGFGNPDSHVTIRDINLTRDPVAVNDRYTFDEDTPLAGNLISNDVLAGTQVSQVNLQTQPAHGSVTIDANGNI